MSDDELKSLRVSTASIQQSGGVEAFLEIWGREILRMEMAPLDGHPLVANASQWRAFPVLSNARWSYKNMALVGDALHTAHFSIGSGTRLAMEDVIALVKALEASPDDMRKALAGYEATRKPVLEKLVTAAAASADWHEHFPKHMELSPKEFAMSYMTRSGRIDRARLREIAPEFVAWYESP